MDAEGTPGDGFEFNLTRVLEMLDERAASVHERSDPPGRRAAEFLSGLGRARAEMDAGAPTGHGAVPTGDLPSPAPAAPDPVTTPTEPALAPLPHRVPGAHAVRVPEAGVPAAAGTPATAPSPVLPGSASVAAAAAVADALPTRTPTAPTIPTSLRVDAEPAARPDGLAALNRVVGDTDLSRAAAEAAPVLPPPVPRASTPPEAASGDQRVKMPTVADVRQFQRAQYRQARRNRKGKLAGRVMLTFMLVGGATAGALTVGRPYLFPADWSDDLAPLVDEIEAARGVTFDDVIEVVPLARGEFAERVSHAVFGPDPGTRVAVWRALGLASGEIETRAVAEALIDVHPAVLEADHGRIAVLEGRAVDVRALLHRALDSQLGIAAASGSPDVDVLGPLPVVRATAVVGDAADGTADEGPSTIVATADGVVGTVNARSALAVDGVAAAGPEPVEPVDPTALTDALPIAYQAEAGAHLLAELTPGAPPRTFAALADGLRRAPDPTLPDGDVAVSDPVRLGSDDWALIWANRLPGAAVDTLLAGTEAESTQTFRRGDTLCVAAVFGSANELYAAAALESLVAWAAAAPVEAQAAAVQLAPTFVQLTTCDPGPGVPQGVNRAAVAAVVGRQVARLQAAATAGVPSAP